MTEPANLPESDGSSKPRPATAGALLAGRPLAQLAAAAGLFGLGVGGRYYLAALPNVETLMVAGWLAMVLLPPGRAIGLFIGLYWASNWALGFHHLLWSLGGIYLFTYSGFLFVALAAWALRRHANKNLEGFTGRAVLSSAAYGALFVAIFDTWTNFGVFWLWYPHSWTYLLQVFIQGAPFALLHLSSAVSSFTLVGLPLVLGIRWLLHRPVDQSRPAFTTQKIRLALASNRRD